MTMWIFETVSNLMKNLVRKLYKLLNTFSLVQFTAKFEIIKIPKFYSRLS
jgi:hypothetical protein